MSEEFQLSSVEPKHESIPNLGAIRENNSRFFPNFIFQTGDYMWEYDVIGSMRRSGPNSINTLGGEIYRVFSRKFQNGSMHIAITEDGKVLFNGYEVTS